MEMIEDDQIKDADKILEEDLYQKHEEYFNFKRPIGGSLIISLIIALSAFILLFFVYVFLEFEGDYFAARIAILYIAILIALYFLVNSIIIGIMHFIDTGALTNFWNFAISKNNEIIRVIMTILLYSGVSVITSLDYRRILNDRKNEEGINGLIVEYLMNYFTRTLLVMVGILLIILIKRLILQFLTWRIHHQCYSERILENEKLVRYLISLNSLVRGNMLDDPFHRGKRIYKNLRRNELGLTIDDFNSLFGMEGENIFKIFDKNSDGLISEDEFVKRYVSLFKERHQLLRSIDSHDDEMRKLDAIMNLIVIPIAAYVAFSSVGHASSVSKFFYSTMGILLPLSFIFGPLVSEVFWSLIFIFLVRPYDLGDEIIIDGVHFSVGEMGLLYSVFFADGKYHSFSNAILRSKVIINLRRTRAVGATFVKKVSYTSSKDKMNLLKNRISAFLNENPLVYSQKFSVGDFLIEMDTLRFKIEIVIFCPYQEIDAVKKRKDKFGIFLHESLCDLGIEMK